ncbi:H(+)-transporting V1 sector ATPase subunit H [Malassezia vespertilionis]|uniref:Vma13p n=1 Tax=Malassezia vespertilionis TaxID=2020962 RepID=A0A2N1JGZ1_9BASI|nr:H(+)-transporting V1 sector ATPase subunit H [Malassezia vespertilionis]PKI85805.1 Vma13p [Malassezia vespertilionis]WFD05353.1 H(+)-transporting V1 sector ATPase subunit H [Malassezia vespertilionis]
MPAKQAKEAVAAGVPLSPLLPLENDWLDSTADRLRDRQTAWEGYQRADLISNEELQMLRDAEQAGREHKMQTVLEKGAAYAALYMRLLNRLNRADTLQQVLLLSNDLAQAAPDKLGWFFAPADEEDATYDQPFQSTVKLLDVDNAYVNLKGAQLLAIFATFQGDASAQAPKGALEALVRYIYKVFGAAIGRDGSTADESEGNATLIVLTILADALRVDKFRRLVWHMSEDAYEHPNQDTFNLVSHLITIVRTTAHARTQSSARDAPVAGKPQEQYLTLLCLWILSFDKDAASKLETHFSIAPVLVYAAETALKQKIVRLVIGIWSNMLAAEPKANATRLLGAKTLVLCETLEGRKYADKEMEAELEHVMRTLDNRLAQMSSYDQYCSELYSGKLSFDNPVHALDDFWKENAEKLVENDDKVLRQLVSLLKPGAHTDEETLAVACSDMGKFIHYFDGARRHLDKAGAKQVIMSLIDHADGNVKYHALQTLARLVSTSWK